MKVSGTIRAYPAGTPVASVDVDIIRESDDTVLDTLTTDADGRWEYTQNGSPGPWRWEATDATPTPDIVRVSSSLSAGSGGAYSLAELVPALRVLGNGVVADYGNELAVTYDAAGLDLDIDTGAAVVNGIPAVFDAVTDLTSVGTRDATNPKACYVVLAVTGAGESEEGKAELVAVCGTAAASPALPSLTQTDALYQLPLASYQLPNTSSTTLTAVTDLRTFAGTRNPVVSSVVRRTDPTSATTTTSTTGEDLSGLTTTVTLLDGVTYDLEAHALVLVKAAAGQTVSIAPYLNGTGNLATYVASNVSSDYLAIGNAYTLAGVAGSGAAVNCGLRWKVSGGTGNAITGHLLVVATPRS